MTRHTPRMILNRSESEQDLYCGTYCGIRPFLRRQGKFFLMMRRADRIANVVCVVVPRSWGTLHYLYSPALH